jgi:DNA-binding MarR family transcriptional regulator
MPRAPAKRPTKPVSSLETHLGYHLRFVSNHVSQAFAAKLAGRGVTVAEWVVLRELYERDGVAPSTLADSLNMTRGGVSKLVERLCARSLLTRDTGTGDQRYQQLRLTDAGRELVPELAALADQNDAEFFGHLTPDDRRHLQDTLEEIVRRRQLTSIPVD